MSCAACQHENPADSRFCEGCGAALERSCAACGAAVSAGARFCRGCGAPLAAGSAAAPPRPAPAPERSPRSYTPKHLADKILQSKSALEGERKQVTVLFADVKSSMELAESIDAEEWHRILDRFFQILADGVHRFEGTVNQYTGDGIMALFGAPIAHEDHAQRACFAALHLRDALREYAEELKRTRGLAFAVRIGINSGEVVVGKIGDDLRMDYTAQGQTVGLAQRLEALADPGRVYVAEATAKLVAGYFALRDLGEFSLKSVREPVRVHELEGPGALRTRFDLSRARGLSRFVGRAAEMATLDTALERALAGQGNVLGVVAEPGTGKSRLCFELAERARARGVGVREAHGVPHGKQVPFLPVLALLRGLFGIGERDGDAEARQKIAGTLVLLDASFERSLPIWFEFLGVPDASRPALDVAPDDRERLVFEGVRRLIRAQSERSPMLILLEDLHWFDGASERMLAPLVEAVRETRTLLLVNFRPEFHAEWMQRSGYQQLPLPPLGTEAAAELLRALLGPDPALATLGARIAVHAGGNPFFVEELVQALVEDGSLTGSRGGHRLARPVDALVLPGTLQAVLAARIDRLAEREKQVLQAAAVIGSELDARILARVSELAEPELLASLRALAQAELVLERSLYPDVVYGFKHPLTQEVALRSQLGARRAERHAATARALEALTSPEKLDEQAALLAHHWQEAGEPLASARWYLRAASWARSRAPDEAERHALEARRLCDSLPVSQETVALGLAARLVLVGIGDFLMTPAASLREFLREGRELAGRGGDRRLFAEMLADFGLVRSVGATVDYLEAISSLEEAEAIADSLGDRKLRQRVRLLLLVSLRQAGRLRDAHALAEEGVEDPTGLVLPYGVSASTFLTAQRGLLRVMQGRLDEAERDIDHAIEATQRASELLNLWLYFRTELAGVRGDAASILRDAARLAALARPGVATDEGFVSRALGIAYRVRGDWREAAAELEKVLSRAAGAFNIARADLAEARLELGDFAAAKEIALAAALDFARDADPIPEISAQLVLARVLMRADGAPARVAIESAHARAEALIAETGARVHEPTLHVERAALAHLLGNEVERTRELACAERLFREIGAPLRADAIASQLRGLGT